MCFKLASYFNSNGICLSPIWNVQYHNEAKNLPLPIKLLISSQFYDDDLHSETAFIRIDFPEPQMNGHFQRFKCTTVKCPTLNCSNKIKTFHICNVSSVYLLKVCMIQATWHWFIDWKQSFFYAEWPHKFLKLFQTSRI